MATASNGSDDSPQDELSLASSVSGDSNLPSNDSSDSALFENDLISSDSYETPSMSKHSRQLDSKADELAEDDFATGPEAAAVVFEGAKHSYVEVTLLLVQYFLRQAHYCA